jgi:cell filamentation protein
MPKYCGNDHYIDPESGVLKNRLGITDEASLEAAEADFVAERSRELSQTPLKGRFDLAHLQAMHRHLFGDVYDWAGELRTVDISKGGHLFAHYIHIGAAAGTIFKNLAQEKNLAGLGPTHSATARRIISGS